MRKAAKKVSKIVQLAKNGQQNIFLTWAQQIWHNSLYTEFGTVKLKLGAHYLAPVPEKLFHDLSTQNIVIHGKSYNFSDTSH